MVRGALIAMIMGVGIALQVRVLGRVSAEAGPHVVGLLVSVASLATALVAVAVARDWGSVARTAGNSDWVIAGVLGVVAIAGLGLAATRAGTVVTLAASIAGQLVAGALVDRIQ